LQGCAISSYQYFNTPLGQIKVASECYQPLLDAHLVQVNDPAHISEHALEVQLPFLQLMLFKFEIVPIVVGQCSPDIVSKILQVLHVDDPATLVVVSSDLSHFHPYSQAKVLDQNTIDRILNYDNKLVGEDACGCHAINGLLDYAKQQNWQVKLIKQANSGDVIADKNRVVGYASFILY
jgi:AmmeMemoRadiSam system protein B